MDARCERKRVWEKKKFRGCKSRVLFDQVKFEICKGRGHYTIGHRIFESRKIWLEMQIWTPSAYPWPVGWMRSPGKAAGKPVDFATGRMRAFSFDSSCFFSVKSKERSFADSEMVARKVEV